MLEQSGIDTEVEIEVNDDRLIIRAVGRSRVGWDEAFAAMAERKDDVLLDDALAQRKRSYRYNLGFESSSRYLG